MWGNRPGAGTFDGRHRLLAVSQAQVVPVQRPSDPLELDELTMARAIRGDRGAFRRLVERYDVVEGSPHNVEVVRQQLGLDQLPSRIHIAAR